MSILEQIVMWSLAIIFAGSAGLNLAGPEFVREEFEKWNYPSWLRFAVAVMEFAAAALLLMEGTRVYGAILALAILASVIFSMTKTREWLRMQFPLLMAALCVGLLACERFDCLIPRSRHSRTTPPPFERGRVIQCWLPLQPAS